MRFAGIDPQNRKVREELGLLDAGDVPTVGKSSSGESFPGEDGLILRQDEEAGARTLVVARWGLQPFWAEDDKFGKKNAYNARAETVAEKPTFRDAFRHRRCVIPAEAFYERAEGRWLRVAPARGEFFAFAGLWEAANERTAGMPTFTMVTTEPNETVGEVHDRMPVVLAPEDAGLWMAADVPPDLLRQMLVPCPPEWTRVEDAGPIGGRRKPAEASLFD